MRGVHPPCCRSILRSFKILLIPRAAHDGPIPDHGPAGVLGCLGIHLPKGPNQLSGLLVWSTFAAYSVNGSQILEGDAIHHPGNSSKPNPLYLRRIKANVILFLETTRRVMGSKTYGRSVAPGLKRLV